MGKNRKTMRHSSMYCGKFARKRLSLSWRRCRKRRKAKTGELWDFNRKWCSPDPGYYLVDTIALYEK